MKSYRREKREDAVKSSRRKSLKKEMSISLGCAADSFESLQAMCNDKANELIKSAELDNVKELKILFWTRDFCEFIGIAYISRNDAEQMTYRLDFSAATV